MFFVFVILTGEHGINKVEINLGEKTFTTYLNPIDFGHDKNILLTTPVIASSIRIQVLEGNGNVGWKDIAVYGSQYMGPRPLIP